MLIFLGGFFSFETEDAATVAWFRSNKAIRSLMLKRLDAPFVADVTDCSDCATGRVTEGLGAGVVATVWLCVPPAAILQPQDRQNLALALQLTPQRGHVSLASESPAMTLLWFVLAFEAALPSSVTFVDLSLLEVSSFGKALSSLGTTLPSFVGSFVGSFVASFLVSFSSPPPAAAASSLKTGTSSLASFSLISDSFAFSSVSIDFVATTSPDNAAFALLDSLDFFPFLSFFGRLESFPDSLSSRPFPRKGRGLLPRGLFPRGLFGRAVADRASSCPDTPVTSAMSIVRSLLDSVFREAKLRCGSKRPSDSFLSLRKKLVFPATLSRLRTRGSDCSPPWESASWTRIAEDFFLDFFTFLSPLASLASFLETFDFIFSRSPRRCSKRENDNAQSSRSSTELASKSNVAPFRRMMEK
mmetsp:Transcript_12948/g.36681  ORF Transcript_12948/g.36681 Transcript_12948/m.36681 type:complete len:415 (+) Transcript_12948:85-1329(+)